MTTSILLYLKAKFREVDPGAEVSEGSVEEGEDGDEGDQVDDHVRHEFHGRGGANRQRLDKVRLLSAEHEQVHCATLNIEYQAELKIS